MGNSGHEQFSGRLSNCHVALLLAVALRVAYSAVGAFFGLFLPVNWNLIHSNALTDNLPAPNHGPHYLMFGIWQRFDTLWYLHIARYGYDRPDAVVFYPLYSYLIKILSWLLQPIAAALLISTSAAFFLFWGFQNLLRMDFDSDHVRKTLMVYTAWPSSFIFFAGYPESLLLAFVLWSLYFARKQKWAAAVMLCIAAEMTKAVGVIITVPLFIMAIRRRTASAWGVLLTPLGALAFPAWVRWSGHGTISSAYEHYWRTRTAPPWATLWVAAEHLLHRPDVLLVLNLLFLILICALLARSRSEVEYRVFALAAILLVLCKQTDPPLQSMMRYVLVVFPAFIAAAQLSETPRWKRRFWPACAGLFAINLALMWLFLGWSLVL